MHDFVLIHSTGQSPAGWQRVVAALGRRGHHAHAVDLPTDRPELDAAGYATADRTIRPDWQRRMARERLGVDPVEIPTGHCPNVSQPELLADLLAAAAD